ncbi:MAG: DEAD/DEAH box helicase [Bryobacterales bacterium]|nr:DEAD/DEAH box helicase [Bryobacterales bacterium]MDE0294181.1 DEAD/DEAH box helicase [Bryobacterales bacterium]
MNKHEEKVGIFTAMDRLRLLQLMTRRAMAERRARACKQEDEGSDAPRDESKGLQTGIIPDRWCLVPEGVSLYDWQRMCLPLWLAHGRGTVKVATGGGKTLFALAVAQQLQNEREPDLRFVVVVPTIPLMYQWRDEVRLGNLPHSAIALMGGGEELPSLSGVRVLICVLNSARKKLAALVKKADWRQRMLLVVDECHRSNATQARQIFDAAPQYTLGLSATPEQELEAENLPTDEAYEKSFVGQALGPIIYDFTISQSLAAGLLTPFQVWHIALSLAPGEAKEHSRLSREISDLRKVLQARHSKSRSHQGFLAWCQSQASRGGPAAIEAERFVGLANRRKRLLYRATARADVTLAILSESVSNPDGRTIVFHESIEEIEALFLRATEQSIPAVLEHSQLPGSLRAENIEAFRQGTAQVIISAKSLIEGFNVPSADLGIIAASSGSVRQRIQSLGRMLRRKPSGRGARIVVLYVRDTEDEAIYEKAAWEDVVGTERNRYFVWRGPVDGKGWTMGLEEAPGPPRCYRPSSREVDVDSLKKGDPYPGKPDGLDLRVDQDGNLRTEGNALVPVASEIIEAILEHNPYRRAKRTPAGHLIVRIDPHNSKGVEWRYLGKIELTDDGNEETAIRLQLKQISGRRVIAHEDERRKGIVPFALGPEASCSPEAGEARNRLLEWVRGVEKSKGIKARELYWDKNTRYWLEISGQRIEYHGPLAPLEFRT